MSMNDEDMSGAQKAAILLISLGPEKSANIFKHLKEDEIEALTLDCKHKKCTTGCKRTGLRRVL